MRLAPTLSLLPTSSSLGLAWLLAIFLEDFSRRLAAYRSDLSLT
jgi:hypothetical protein